MRADKVASLAAGIAIGALYGALAFGVFDRAYVLPGATFLFLVPAVTGAIPLLFSDADQTRWYVKLVLLPWLTLLALYLLLFVLLRETSLLCVLVQALPAIGLAMLGTLIAWVITAVRLRRRKKKLAAGILLMLLPFVCAPLERALLYRSEVVASASRIVIDAPRAAVWDQLANVPAFQPDEYRPGVWQLLGVPRPIRATVDREALGGHRVGWFDRGLRFDEVITAYDPPARMSFSIAVDPRTLIPGSAERHAFEHGYFRFLDADYSLAELPGGRTELVLASRYAIESGVNWYGKLWAGAIVRDFQDRVLAVIKSRSEHLPRSAQN